MFPQTLQTSANPMARWRIEQSAINNAIRRLRCRIAAAISGERPGLASEPDFRSLVEQIQTIDGQLRLHFQHTLEIYHSLGGELWCIEVESAKRIAMADQTHLLDRLQSLMARLSEIPSPIASMADAVDELEWIFDELDQHEECESDSFEWLLHSACD